MNKSTKWIVAALVLVFAGLIVATNMMKDPYNEYDLTKEIPADAHSGNIAETTSGNADAPATLVVYTDYQCNNCASLMPDLKKLQDEYKDKLKIVYRIMIMSYHQNGRAAAAAVLAAAQQGYFEQYKTLMYEKQEDWAGSDASLRQEQFEQYFIEASDKKGDLEKFKEDMKSNEVSKKIAFDDRMADLDGVEWTPYLKVGGELVSQQEIKTRAELLDKLREKIDAQIEAAK